MTSKQTTYRVKRRDLLKSIFNIVFDLNSFNDTKLERIPFKSLKNIELNLADARNLITRGGRYINQTYIYPNDTDELVSN